MPKALTDMASMPHVQPVLFDASEIEQPKRRRRGSVRKREPLEREIQKLILDALSMHPLVARIERINVMAGRLYGKDGRPSRFMRSCRKGRVDLDGFTTDGRVIAIEVKRPSTRNDMSDEQRAYLDQVKSAGGLAGVACCVNDAFRIVEGRIPIHAISWRRRDER